MTEETIKTCLYCRWFGYRSGMGAVSEYSQGSPPDIGCDKHKWEIDFEWDNEFDLVLKLSSPDNCSEYEYVSLEEIKRAGMAWAGEKGGLGDDQGGDQEGA